MFSIDHLDVLPVMRRTSVTLAIDLEPEELELALASNGASLQEALMMAIISALTLDTEVEALAN